MLKHLKNLSLLTMIIILMFNSYSTSYAQDNSIIQIDGPEVIYDVNDTVVVTISHLNQNDINSERLYLSYHILDENGNILLFDNPRYHIEDCSLETVNLEIKIDLYNLKSDNKEIYLQYDIVDEQNAFWYSDRGMLSDNKTKVVLKGWNRFVQMLKKQIQDHTTIFVGNLLFSVCFIVLIFVLKAKDKAYK